MENGSLGSLQMDTCARGGKLPCMFGSLGMCCSAWYRFMGVEGTNVITGHKCNKRHKCNNIWSQL